MNTGANDEYLLITGSHYKRGWARRIKVDGSYYEKAYISNYLDDIEELFQRGKKNSSDEMNPAQMRDTLIAKYPNRFRIPSDTEIKQEIGHSKLAISIGRIGLQKGTGETGGNV